MLSELTKDAKKQHDKRHLNQLNLILKNKYVAISRSLMDADELNNGYLNFEKLDNNLRRLGFSEERINKESMKSIFERYKLDDHNFNYRKFLKDIKEFEFKPDDIYVINILKFKSYIN